MALTMTLSSASALFPPGRFPWQLRCDNHGNRNNHKCFLPTRQSPFVNGKYPYPWRTHSRSWNATASQATVAELVQPPGRGEQSTEDKGEDLLKPVDPEFFKMGYVRYVRAYGVEFKEGPKGIGVYAARDLPKLKSPRIIMEIPLELMITIPKKPPWVFYPNFVPIGHPIFEVIDSTDPEKDWDFRLACLLLLSLDQKDHFWQMYSDYLPGFEDLTSLLLATEDEKAQLHNKEFEEVITSQQKRGVDFWKRSWTSDSVLKLRRLAFDEDQFLWALGVVWSRNFLMNITIGSLNLDAYMLIPYVDMLNHSFQPTCSCRWRRKDRMLEVVINRGQTIKRGEEMTLNYSESITSDALMQYYGFSSALNPSESLHFSGNAKIHRDSFLSVFNFSGVYDDSDYVRAAELSDGLIDGAHIAAARNLPMWSDEEDLPFLPSQEIAAAKALKQECRQLLETYPTTIEEDRRILESASGKSAIWRAAVKYRMDRKRLIGRIMELLDQYAVEILF